MVGAAFWVFWPPNENPDGLDVLLVALGALWPNAGVVDAFWVPPNNEEEPCWEPPNEFERLVPTAPPREFWLPLDWPNRPPVWF